MNEVDLMVRSLYDLTQQIPSQATLSSKQRVSQIAQSFHNSISEKGNLEKKIIAYVWIIFELV